MKRIPIIASYLCSRAQVFNAEWASLRVGAEAQATSDLVMARSSSGILSVVDILISSSDMRTMIAFIEPETQFPAGGQQELRNVESISNYDAIPLGSVRYAKDRYDAKALTR